MTGGAGVDGGVALGLLAAVVSVISLATNIALTRRAQRFAAEALRLDIDRQLISWADEVVIAMGRATQLAARTGDTSAARDDVLRDLSVLLDRGRWHAPNIPHVTHGADNPAAYRGHRQPALDCVHAVYEVIGKSGSGAEADVKAISDARRRFVSEVQTLTDPRRRREFLRRAEASKATTA
jgi:hypothetical protein